MTKKESKVPKKNAINSETEPAKTLSLNGTKFYEEFDENALLYILLRKEMFKKYGQFKLL